MNATTRLLFSMLIATAFSPTVFANKTAHQIQIEQGWMQSLNPQGKAPQGVTSEQIDEALLLLDKTAQWVQSQGGNLSAAQKNTLKSFPNQWAKLQGTESELVPFYFKIRTLRRAILFTHPKLDFETILINRNPPTLYSHNGDQHLGRHSRSGPGLTTLTQWKAEPIADAFLQGKLPKGATRNPDLHYDAERVVFAFSNHEMTQAPLPDKKSDHLIQSYGKSAPDGSMERRYFLYEAALDGSWVRQLTGTVKDPLSTQDGRVTAIVEDNDPCYMPDDSITFISTRSQTYGRCHGGRYNPAWVLHTCDSNGLGIRQLSFGNENEYEPSVINDGRIVFSRWEYTNRHEMLFHMLWGCRPDGTGVANYFGNDTLFPMMIVEQSAIPGTHKVVATAQGHHQYNTGTIIVIDTSVGENGEKPLTHITPETPYAESSSVNRWPKAHYSHPNPITEHLFLVSKANHPLPHQKSVVPANDRAIYLIDDLGGREFIYEDPDYACVSPIAVQKRVRPTVLPSMTTSDRSQPGTLFLQNAYLTRNDPNNQIEPGSIKSLRINALGVQPRARRLVSTPYVNVEIPKKVLGTVPINADGSACFSVPACTPIQVQALDKDGVAILTEKTFFYLQPGENRSCVGCHEEPGTSPNMKTMAGLMQQGPSTLEPAAGPSYPGGLAFSKTVQPVLDRYCIGCHGLDKTEGNVNLLNIPFKTAPLHDESVAGLTNQVAITWMKPKQKNRMFKSLEHYPSSYTELTLRGDFTLGSKASMGNADRNISVAYEPLYARGCKLTQLLLTNHGHTNMDADSRMRLIEWMDLNAPMNGDLFPERNRMEDRQWNEDGMTALREEIRKQLGNSWADQPASAWVNRSLPEESRILMAPLAAKAGGWGKTTLWASKDDPRFKRMEALVLASFTKPANENDMGWTPSANKGATEAWISADRAAYLEWIKQNSAKSF